MTRDEFFENERKSEKVGFPVSLLGKDKGIDNSHNCFLMTASGSGMVNAGIYDGDTMIFSKCSSATNGAIVAVLIDGELACRRYIRSGKRVVFRRENGVTPDVKPNYYEILGIMVTLVRKYNYVA